MSWSRLSGFLVSLLGTSLAYAITGLFGGLFAVLEGITVPIFLALMLLRSVGLLWVGRLEIRAGRKRTGRAWIWGVVTEILGEIVIVLLVICFQPDVPF